MSLSVMLEAVLPVYLMVAVGVLVRWRGVITAEMEKGMLKLVIHCLYPCLILDKTLGNPLVRESGIVGWGIGLGCGIIVLGMGVSWGVASALGLERGSGKRTFALSAGVQNFGYTAIPILAVLFATVENDSVLGVLFVHSLGVEIAIWVIGLAVMTGRLPRSFRVFMNGPILAVLLGVGLSWTGGWQFFDSHQSGVMGGVLRQAMSWLGGCAFPIGLMLIGATMFDLAGRERLSWRIGVGAVIVRLLIMPVVILALARFLPLPLALKQVLLVQAAMPAAVTPIIVARHHGGTPGVAVQTVLMTSVLALVSIPFWLKVGMEVLFSS